MERENEVYAIAGDQEVYVNHGSLLVIFQTKDRAENAALLDSLFEHMGDWFRENADKLAAPPMIDGDTFQIVTETPGDVPVPGVGDTFPEEWL